MPIFEYRCADCGHLQELLQKHTDPAPDECPACRKTGTMGKELSASAFHLKGGGWYKDLYSSTSSSGSPANGSSTNGAAGSTSSAGGTTTAGSSSTSSAGSTSGSSTGGASASSTGSSTS